MPSFFKGKGVTVNTGGINSGESWLTASQQYISLPTYTLKPSLPHKHPSQVFTSNQMVDELLREVWLSPQGDCLQADLKPPELQSEINACHLFLFLAENGEYTTASFCEAAEPCVWNVLVHYFPLTCYVASLTGSSPPSFSSPLPSTNVCCLKKALLSVLAT